MILLLVEAESTRGIISPSNLAFHGRIPRNLIVLRWGRKAGPRPRHFHAEDGVVGSNSIWPARAAAYERRPRHFR
jgi:hypothetical protein